MSKVTLSEIIAKMVQIQGEEVLVEQQLLLALFMDLAPQQKREKELLRLFSLCDGPHKILNMKKASRQEQEACMNKLVRELEENYGISENAAKYVCAEFYHGVTGNAWTFPTPVTGEVKAKALDSVQSSWEKNTTVCGNVFQTRHPWWLAAAAAVLLLCILIIPKLGEKQSSPVMETPGVSNQTVQDQSSTGKNPQSNEPAHVHQWKDATCTSPQKCSTCGEISGDALGHQWIDATYDNPKMCRICGVTEGRKLGPDPVYINELSYSDKYGKIWTLSKSTPSYFVHTDVDDAEDYKDMNTPGHTTGQVYDYLGNSYTYGIHVDGDEYASYYITYDIGGVYRTFTGVACMSADMDGDSRASTYSKYFEVYGDGVLLFRSLDFSQGSSPQKFSIDVSGVEILMIRYPKTSGPSRLATIFDGKLS